MDEEGVILAQRRGRKNGGRVVTRHGFSPR